MYLNQFIEGIEQAHGISVQSHTPSKQEFTLGGLDIIEATGTAVLADGSTVEIRTTGKGSTSEARLWSAAMEILERIVVLEARADIRSSFKTLRVEALSPTRMTVPAGTPAPEDVILDWSMANSCCDGRRVLVPRPVRGGASGLFNHTTNGAAGGQGWEDALKRGLLEVIERDALLTTWFARRTASTLTRPFDAEGEEVAAWLGRHGFQVTGHRLQSDSKVPVILMLAIQAADGPISRGGVIAGSAAGLDESGALKGALLEIVQVVEVIFTTPRIDWNAWPESLRYFAESDRSGDFAFLGADRSTLIEIASYEHISLIIEHLFRLGFEAFATNRSPAWLQPLPLALLEVQIPGLQPLVLPSTTGPQRIAWNRFSPAERPLLKLDPHPLG